METKYFDEFMCELFMEHLGGGHPVEITGGGYIGSKDDCFKWGEKHLNKMARHWTGKEEEALCVAYKVWQQVQR